MTDALHSSTEQRLVYLLIINRYYFPLGASENPSSADLRLLSLPDLDDLLVWGMVSRPADLHPAVCQPVTSTKLSIINPCDLRRELKWAF